MSAVTIPPTESTADRLDAEIERASNQIKELAKIRDARAIEKEKLDRTAKKYTKEKNVYLTFSLYSLLILESTNKGLISVVTTSPTLTSLSLISQIICPLPILPSILVILSLIFT